MLSVTRFTGPWQLSFNFCMLENDQPVIVLLQSTTFHFCFLSNCSPSLLFSSNLRNRVTVIYVLACALLQAQKVIFLTKKIISMDRRTPLSGQDTCNSTNDTTGTHLFLYIRGSHGSMLFKIYLILS